jgi:hypothetical protein
MELYFLIYLHTSFIFLTEYGILPSNPFVKGELLIQSYNMPEDSINIQTDLTYFNDNVPRVDSCFPSQTN